MLSPGLSHNPFIAELAGVEVMDVIAVHSTADVISVVIAAISIAVVAKFLNEDKGYIAKSEAAATSEVNVETPKANLFYALVPILPIVILVLGSTILPALKMGVPQAMLIGAIIAIAVTRTNPQDVSKAFFDGMGSAYGQIMGIIIAAAVFVSGMEAIGIVEAFINMLVNTESVVNIAATFGPFC